MKMILLFLIITSLSFSFSWEAFVKMPLNEKYLIQNEMAKRLNMQNDLKNMLSSYVNDYSMHYPAEYKTAMANVNKYLVNISMPAVQKETKFIKIGGVYVSEATCKANPEQCIVASEPVIQVKNQTVVANKPANKRTAAQCVAARQKDWEARVYSNYPNIPTEGVNEIEKQALLDRIAEGYY
jgi:hypothetical protein